MREISHGPDDPAQQKPRLVQWPHCWRQIDGGQFGSWPVRPCVPHDGPAHSQRTLAHAQNRISLGPAQFDRNSEMAAIRVGSDAFGTLQEERGCILASYHSAG